MNDNNIQVLPLISTDDLQSRIIEIAHQIDSQIKNYKSPPIFLCILKGSFIFFSDLIRQVQSDIQCDFMGCSSYGPEMKSSGEIKITLDLSTPIRDQNIILVEDIVDTGLTINFLVETLKARHPESITVVTLLDKPSKRKTQFKPDIVGFEVGDEFVVGFGLDFAEQFRHLPYIGKITNRTMN